MIQLGSHVVRITLVSLFLLATWQLVAHSNRAKRLIRPLYPPPLGLSQAFTCCSYWCLGYPGGSLELSVKIKNQTNQLMIMQMLALEIILANR